MIKNIVFDVGNVLVHFRWYDYMLDLGISPENTEFLGKNMVLTPFWDRMDLGIENEDLACEHFKKEFPELEREIELFWGNMEEIVREFDYSSELLKALKEMGYGVYVLSNYPPKMYALHWPTFRFRDYDDGEVVSGLEKIAKPDAAIFALLCERYGLNPAECLFVDDRKLNVDAAVDFGMQGFHFTEKDGESALDRLRAFIGGMK